jgi:hypothetical protein
MAPKHHAKKHTGSAAGKKHLSPYIVAYKANFAATQAALQIARGCRIDATVVAKEFASKIWPLMKNGTAFGEAVRSCKF